MPRSSWGSVQKLGRDRWRVRWLEWRGTERFRASKVLRCTKREADAFLAKMRVEHERPSGEQPCPTFSQCWEMWYWPDLQGRVSDGSLALNTAKSYVSSWRNHIMPRWGACPMDAVSSADYQSWVLTKTRAVATAADVLIGNMVTCAIRHDVRGIEFKRVSYRMPRNSRNPSGADVYSADEIDKLLRDVRGTVLEAPCILMAKGSCRVGEACAVRASSLSISTVHGVTVATAWVRDQLSPDGELIPPKTAESMRPVVIAGVYAERLEEIAAERPGAVFLNDNGFGEPVSRYIVGEAWRKLFSKGVTSVRRLRMGRLRNSWETYARWTLGIDKDKIDKMMGHTSADVRSKHYDRPDEIMFAEAVAEAYSRNELGTL